jgi:hypothetical protein
MGGRDTGADGAVGAAESAGAGLGTTVAGESGAVLVDAG